jgi:hypothetical protein
MFKKGKLLEVIGMNSEAGKILQEAYIIRRRLEPSDLRTLEQLEESDFDALVVFWSR